MKAINTINFILLLICGVLSVSGDLSITLTSFPEYNTTTPVEGIVNNIATVSFSLKAVMYVLTNIWYIKPHLNSFQVVDPVTGCFNFSNWSSHPVYDPTAQAIAVFIIPANETAPNMGGTGDDFSFPASFYSISLAHIIKGRGLLTFSGRDLWAIKSTSTPQGPGPNLFSSSPDDVWVDSSGRLHLTIHYRNGAWWCTEVLLRQSLGYGTYSFQVSGINPDSPASASTVLGLFTWDDYSSDRASNAYREIDVEFARWGNVNDPTNAQFVLQPYYLDDHLQRWTAPGITTGITVLFKWEPSMIQWWGYKGLHTPSTTHNNPVDEWPETDLIFKWNTTDKAAIFNHSNEAVHLNYWLSSNDQTPFGNQTPPEVIINSFTYVPIITTEMNTSSSTTTSGGHSPLFDTKAFIIIIISEITMLLLFTF